MYVVGPLVLQVRIVEQTLGWWLELDENLGRRGGQQFPRPQVPGHAGPPPGIDLQAQRAKRLNVRVRRDVLLRAVTLVLTANDVVGAQRTHRAQDVGLGDLHGSETLVRGRLHRQQRHDLEQMVLDDVAQAAGRLVKAAALFNAEVLRHRDLHAGDILAVPDRLEKRIGEAEIQDVHDRFFAQVMVDPKDRRFRKDTTRDRLERDGRGQVATERLFDNDAGVAREPRCAQAANHRPEQVGGNGQVVRRVLRGCQRLLEQLEGLRIPVVAAHVAQQRQHALERRSIVDRALGQEAVVHALSQHLDGQRLRCDANHGYRHQPPLDQGIQGRKDLLARQIARASEHHQRVRLRLARIGRDRRIHRPTSRDAAPPAVGQTTECVPGCVPDGRHATAATGPTNPHTVRVHRIVAAWRVPFGANHAVPVIGRPISKSANLRFTGHLPFTWGSMNP